MDLQSRRIAVLIDADNASAAHAAAIFEEVAKHGEANVRRLYGDVTSNRLAGWVKKLQRLAILAQQTFPYTTGKNASDIALVIDAMDLMHTGAIDVFCLVSSDSDFTRLAQRLRENGKLVLGFGERKTPEAFRSACNRFIYVENLGPAATEEPAEAPLEATGRTAAAKRTGRAGAPAATAPAAAAAAAENGAGEATEAKKDPPSKATPLILKAMADLEDEEGWALLASVGSRLQNFAPDFDPRNYGFSKLSDVARKAGAFDVEPAADGQLRLRQRRQRKRK